MRHWFERLYRQLIKPWHNGSVKKAINDNADEQLRLVKNIVDDQLVVQQKIQQDMTRAAAILVKIIERAA